jgi:menaquinone-specific isochorismate synthase
MNPQATPLVPESETGTSGVENGAARLSDGLVNEALRRANSLQESVLLVWEDEAPQIDPLGWLESESTYPAFYWRGRQAQEEYAGAGAALLIAERGPGSMAVACTQTANILELRVVSPVLPPIYQPRFFGGFAFDPSLSSGPLWSGFDDATLIFPEALLVRSSGHNSLMLSLVVRPGESPANVLLAAEKLRARYRPTGVADFALFPSLEGSLEPDTTPVAWSTMVQAALHRIQSGLLNKIVLSRRLRLRNARLGAWSVMQRLRDRAPSCFHFAFDMRAGRSFVGSTPERLLYRNDDIVETECIAGTMVRGHDGDSDHSLAEHLLSNPKDRLEHYYVVEDTLRCLGDLCDRLDVGTDPHILKLATLQHLMTHARGHLKPGIATGDILTSLHPTPAVGGSPRDAALAAIRELEPCSRGWYGGPVGWLARDQAEFAVAIRSALLTGNEILVFAGAGIVKGSNAEEEWRETENKALAFLNALQ